VRLVFLGSPEEAVGPLRALRDAGHDIALVVTQPDRRRGRGGGHLDPSPVKRAATELGLPVVTPQRCKEVLDDIAATGAELGVVVAFGQMIPQSVLDALPSGYVNMHFSLLPRWRGAAPVERAMLAGDTETGVCLMRLEKGLDTGPVYACERVTIGAGETAGELRARLARLGTELLLSELDSIPGREATVQEGETTYAEKLSVEEFEIDWTRPAIELERLVLAGNPKPGAWTTASGHRLKILRARAEPSSGAAAAAPGAILGPGRVRTGDGVLQVFEVQPEGKPVMPARAWAAGFRGDRLGE
jgi:methionyl-tRNA formyltransferase